MRVLRGISFIFFHLLFILVLPLLLPPYTFSFSVCKLITFIYMKHTWIQVTLIIIKSIGFQIIFTLFGYHLLYELSTFIFLLVTFIFLVSYYDL